MAFLIMPENVKRLAEKPLCGWGKKKKKSDTLIVVFLEAAKTTPSTDTMGPGGRF